MDDFNLYRSKNKGIRQMAAKMLEGKHETAFYSTGKKEVAVIHVPIRNTTWHLMLLKELD